MDKEKLYTADSSIPKEEFELAHLESNIHDTKFETRPIGWLEDSARRFAKNKASVVGAAIILVIALFAIFVPIFSSYNHVSKVDFPNGYQDKNFANVLPKLFSNTGFWDGTETKDIGETEFNLRSYTDANDPFFNPNSVKVTSDVITPTNIINTYTVKWDTYAIGTKNIKLKTKEEFDALVKYEQDHGISYSEENAHKSILKPLIDVETYINGDLITWLNDHEVYSYDSIKDGIEKYYNQNQYVYYKLVPTNKRTGQYSDTQFEPLILPGQSEPEPIYKLDSEGKPALYEIDDNGEYNIRVDYFDYFTYRYGFKPVYIFGANQYGQDIFLRLALGARFSLLLGVGISLINFLIGLVWGAVSGYYGGKVDLVMERVTDIIANVPTIIIMTIAQIQLTNNVGLKAAVGTAGTIVLAILIAFVYNGWVGVASTTRMQFYRFKGQEYVLASRTLGAKDRRLIFKHILPNAVGTLVTSCVLMIPGVIFSESSLSYLGIINFQTSGICSIGALLNEGQAAGIKDNPHILLFPAIVISLLMISFNLFGNGLRDAFNTTLRGSED